MEPESSSPHSHVPVWKFHNMIRFYGEELSALPPTLKLENHPVSAVRDCLFNIFSATFQIGGRSSICNLRTRHAVVTGTHLSTRILTFQTGTVCFPLFSVPLICSLIITTLQTILPHCKRHFNTATEQRFSNLVHSLSKGTFSRKDVVVQFYKKRQA